MKTHRCAGLALVLLVGLAHAAAAAPITMDQDPLVIDSIFGGSITLSLESGDTSDNTLHFRAVTQPLVLDVVSITFDAMIADAGVTFDPDGILGLSFTLGGQTAGALVIDFAGQSVAEFYVAFEETPTEALVRKDLVFTQRVTFSTGAGGAAGAAVPEPGAALAFAAGGLLVATRTRRAAARRSCPVPGVRLHSGAASHAGTEPNRRRTSRTRH